jgi:hypothetical protein
MQNGSSNQQLTVNDIIGISCTNGASGDMSFDDMGWRITTAAYVTLYREISSSNSLERVLIGIVKKDRESHPKFMYADNESPSTVWSGGCIAIIVHALAIDLFSSLPPRAHAQCNSEYGPGNGPAGVDVFTCALDSRESSSILPIALPPSPHPPFPAFMTKFVKAEYGPGDDRGRGYNCMLTFEHVQVMHIHRSELLSTRSPFH